MPAVRTLRKVSSCRLLRGVSSDDDPVGSAIAAAASLDTCPTYPTMSAIGKRGWQVNGNPSWRLTFAGIGRVGLATVAHVQLWFDSTWPDRCPGQEREME